MAYKQIICAICLGNKKIEIGRNLDNKSEKTIFCPICNGRGYININFEFYNTDEIDFWKRLNGDV